MKQTIVRGLFAVLVTILLVCTILTVVYIYNTPLKLSVSEQAQAATQTPYIMVVTATPPPAVTVIEKTIVVTATPETQQVRSSSSSRSQSQPQVTRTPTSVTDVCGQPKLVDFSQDPRSKSLKFIRMGSETKNIYNTSRIRVNTTGCTMPVQVLFQQWCDVNGNCAKLINEWQASFTPGSDNNLQTIFFPGTTIDVNDKGQKLYLWKGQCVILDENDTDENGWQVTFCN